MNEILSAVGMSYTDLHPREPAEVDRVQRARDLWDMGGDGVEFHPYAKRKHITHHFEPAVEKVTAESLAMTLTASWFRCAITTTSLLALS